MPTHVSAPLSREQALALRAGETVLLSGTIFTARDAAHKRLCALLDAGEPLPIPLDGQVVYYAGPCPALPGDPIGACGPTTSSRMDAYAPRLLERGLRGMIGKGPRGEAVREAIARFGGVYFAATGGAGALIAGCVKEARVVAFPELGAEAIRALRVEKLPLIVAVDAAGGDLYAAGPAAYAAAP